MGGQWGRVVVVAGRGAAFAPSWLVVAQQSPGRGVSGRRALPSHRIPLSLLVCRIPRDAGGRILQLLSPRCLQQDDGQDTLPAGGCCFSSQPRRCRGKAANYSSLFNDFWTCSFVTCRLAPFSRCLLGYLCIQVRQAGSGEAARLQVAFSSVAPCLVPVQG